MKRVFMFRFFPSLPAILFATMRYGVLLAFVLIPLAPAGEGRICASQQDSAGEFTAEGMLSIPFHQTVVGEELPGKFDLVLFLHGAGERGTDNRQHLVFGYEPMVRYCVENRIKAVLLFPQCPSRNQWSAIRIPTIDPPLTPEPAPPLASAVGLLCLKKAEFDTGRVYAVGISMGGYGVWDLLVRYPGMFSAAMAICGGGDSARAADLVGLPLYVAHGSNDNLVPVARSRAMVKAIWREGGDKVTYQEFPQVGHSVWNNVFAEDACWEWLFRQRGKKPRMRSRWYPVPKVFPWQSRLF